MDFVERIKLFYSHNARCKFNFEERLLHQDIEQKFKELYGSGINTIMQLDFYKDNKKMIELLRCVPPELLLHEFGEEIITWMFINNPEISPHYFQIERMVKDSSRSDELIDRFIHFKRIADGGKEEYLQQMFSFVQGKDAKLMTKAVTIADKFPSQDKFTFIRKNYILLEKVLLQDSLQQIDLRQLLEKHHRQKDETHVLRVQDYSLETVCCQMGFEGYDPKWFEKQKNSKMVFDIYLDAPLGILLKYKEEPQAVMTFSPIDVNTLKIYQLQGVVPKEFDEDREVIARGNSRGLSSWDWRAFFIDVVECAARRYKFETVVIQSGHNNDWTKDSEGRPAHLLLDAALQKYDTVAERLGFVQQEDKNWYRNVTKTRLLGLSAG